MYWNANSSKERLCDPFVTTVCVSLDCPLKLFHQNISTTFSCLLTPYCLESVLTFVIIIYYCLKRPQKASRASRRGIQSVHCSITLNQNQLFSGFTHRYLWSWISIFFISNDVLHPEGLSCKIFLTYLQNCLRKIHFYNSFLLVSY